MLKNTAFHDNLYQLAKIITITAEGLSLELSENMFLDKMISDISFISDTLQTLFTEVQNLSHKLHTDTKGRIEKRIQESDKNLDTYQIVSQNELSQLLCI